MDPDPGSSKSKRWSFWKGKGSVQRARQMLEAGQRPGQPSVQSPEPSNDGSEGPAATSSRLSQWPLLDSRDLNFLDPQSSRSPRGPPPPRPPRPDAPSPSVYPERSGLGITPSLHHFRPPVRRSFSQPLPPNRDSPSPANRQSDFAPNISVTNEERSRWSTVSDLPSASDSPVSELPKKTTNLAPPQPPPLSKSARHAVNRRSSVSPIPEEPSGESQQSSGAVPSDSPSTGRESDIYGSYIDNDLLDWQEARTSHRDSGGGLVRQASLGKRGKPSLRVIQKPSETSLAASEGRPSTSEEHTIGRSIPEAVVGETPIDRNNRLRVPSPKDSFSSLSDRSYEFDFEKGDFILDIGQDSSQRAQNQGGGANDLPRATGPTMSGKRPDTRRPPKLDMDAVRDAEARGSLTSLPDLIRRATKLASNLDHGRTASRSGVLNNNSSDRLAPWDRQRNSAVLQDPLASFPSPPRRDRSSWPTFFRRSTLHNVETINSDSDHGRGERDGCSQRCCGMPLWLFITLCVALVIIITLAILLPIFLIAVPQQSSASTCKKSTPCENGGVSISSGSTCSCICTNGYTGSRCSILGDVDCTTIAIDGQSSAKTATMGNSLPQLFQDSQQRFGIPLDVGTTMALFSKSNVPCAAQNNLVSFNDLSSGNKSRRSLGPDVFDIQPVEGVLPAVEQSSAASGVWPLEKPEARPTLNIRDSTATDHGIIYDNSSPSETNPIETGVTTTSAPTEAPCSDRDTATPTPTPTPTTSSSTTDTRPTDTATKPTTTDPTTTTPTQTTSTTTSPASTSTSAPSSTATPNHVSPKALAFARTAVLYIFQSTGEFPATLQTEQNIASYLASGGGNQSGDYDVDLSRTGVNAKFSLDFKGFRIRTADGKVVGG